MKIGDSMDSKKIRIIIVMTIILLIAYYILCFFKNYMLVREGEQYLSLYEEVVEELLTSKDNKEMLNDIEYIAFDATSFNIGSDQDKQLLSNKLKSYNDVIIFGNYNMLKEDTFMNEDGSLKGIYIYASELKYGKVSVSFVINMTDYTGTTHGFNVKATYKNNGWNIKKMEPFSSFDLYVS